MTWLIFALLAALTWGIGQVLVKKGFQHTTPLFNNFLATIFGCLIFIPFAFIGGINWSSFPKIFLFAFLAEAFGTIYYYAAEKGEISLTGTLISIFPVFIIILSTIFLGEKVSMLQAFAIFIIILGSFLVSKPKKFSLKFEPWVVWGFITALALGFGDFMGKVTLTKFDLNSFLFAFAVSYVITMIFIYFIDKKGRKFPKLTQRKLIPTLSGTFLLEVGVLFFYLGLNSGEASLVSPVSSAYVAVTIILALIFLKEKMTKTQLLGVLFAAAGIILIGV
jgi:transporter family protein